MRFGFRRCGRTEIEYVWKSIKRVISATFIRHPDKSGCGIP